MGYIAMTPFGRRVDACLLQQLRHRPDTPAPRDVDKWQVLRDLTAARDAFALKHRTLSVLQALLGFHKGTVLGSSPAGFVVHPSNASLSDRLAGMPESTLRRHLAILLKAGLLLRRDSPNGKRYVRRGADGPNPFGFDLSPLAHRAAEIADAAATARAHEAQLAECRRSISLLRRDLMALSEAAADDLQAPEADTWLTVELPRLLRRQLDREELAEIERILTCRMTEIADRLALVRTAEKSVSDAQNERHIQSSEEELIRTSPSSRERHRRSRDVKAVARTCRELSSYAHSPISTWNEMISLATRLAPMIGLSKEAWTAATTRLGPEGAALLLGLVFERLPSIRSPGAYWMALVARAGTSAFCLDRLLRSVQRSQESQL